MCTKDLLREEAEARRAASLSRRDFNLMALSAAAIAALPGEALAGELQSSMVEVKTGAGTADAYLALPRTGKHAGVVLWPDFMSLRPTYRQLADKLARSGYAVLVPNVYYRAARSPIIDKADFDNKDVMGKIGGYVKALTASAIADDARAYVAFLDQHAGVDPKRKLGTLGYCMGGGYAFQTAAVAPGRVGAVASFHGSLVQNDPGSAHLLIPQIKAQALVAIAAGDDKANPAEKTVLREAFARTKVPADIQVFDGTEHGWCTPDMLTLYNAAQAERAWSRLLALLQRALP